MRSPDPQRLGRADVDLVRHRVVHVRQLLPRGRAARQRGPVDLRRLADGAVDVEEVVAVLRHLERVDGLVVEELRDRAAGEVGAVDRVAPLDRAGEEDRLPVAAPMEVVDPVVERPRHDARRAALAVVDRELKELRLVRRRLLRPVGDGAAIGRVLRRVVVAAVRRGDVPRRRVRRFQVDDPDVGVRRRRRVDVVIRRHRELARVGREGVLQRPAQLEAGEVETAGGQVAHRLRLDVDEERVRGLAIAPLRPVAIEQRIGHVRLELPFAPAVGDLLVAGVVGVALGIDVGGEGDPLAVGRPERVGDARGDGCELPRLAAGERQQIEVAGADEGDRLPVGREVRRRVAVAVGQLARVRAVGVHDPDARRPLRPRQVGGRHGEEHGAPVGRERERADAANAVDVLDGEGALLGEGGRGDYGQEQEQQEAFHGGRETAMKGQPRQAATET